MITNFEIAFIVGPDISWTNDTLLREEFKYNFDTENPNSGKWLRGGYRVWLETEKDVLQVIILCDYLDGFYDAVVRNTEVPEFDNELPDRVKEIIQLLEVVLTDDVWSVDGTQFRFTETGKKVSDLLKDGIMSWKISPDVSIQKDPKIGYSWSS